MNNKCSGLRNRSTCLNFPPCKFDCFFWGSPPPTKKKKNKQNKHPTVQQKKTENLYNTFQSMQLKRMILETFLTPPRSILIDWPSCQVCQVMGKVLVSNLSASHVSSEDTAANLRGILCSCCLEICNLLSSKPKNWFVFDVSLPVMYHIKCVKCVKISFSGLCFKVSSADLWFASWPLKKMDLSTRYSNFLHRLAIPRSRHAEEDMGRVVFNFRSPDIQPNVMGWIGTDWRHPASNFHQVSSIH